jgi:hypothetical protein
VDSKNLKKEELLKPMLKSVTTFGSSPKVCKENVCCRDLDVKERGIRVAA